MVHNIWLLFFWLLFDDPDYDGIVVIFDETGNIKKSA